MSRAQRKGQPSSSTPDAEEKRRAPFESKVAELNPKARDPAIPVAIAAAASSFAVCAAAASFSPKEIAGNEK